MPASTRSKICRYDVVGSLDADISFEPDYFEFLLEKFVRIRGWALPARRLSSAAAHYDYRFTNIEHVSGACQLFRRECFEEIGGYVPIKGGGIDWTAVTTARMKGWQTRTFTAKTCLHHRPMGTGQRAASSGGYFRHGQKDYYLGGHPVWQVFRCAYQMTQVSVLGRRAFAAGRVLAGPLCGAPNDRFPRS